MTCCSPHIRRLRALLATGAACIAALGILASSAEAHTPLGDLRLSSTSIGPAGPSVSAEFKLGSRSRVAATVIRNGTAVRPLVTGWRSKGTQRAVWDGRDHHGAPVAPGRYTLILKVRTKGHPLVTQRAQITAVGAATPPTAVPPATTTQLRWPVLGPMSSPFGPRRTGRHDGVDILAEEGRPILSAAAGTVTFAGSMDGYGLTTVVQHPTGHSTLYAHQSRLGSKTGDTVTDGQVIGYVGSTGRSSAPHLHFEVRTPERVAIDPLLMLPRAG